MKGRLIEHFNKVNYVCTTADIWSTNHKSYLGVTAHWIDPQTLLRSSAALACERMKGRHTYDVIAAALNAVHTAYRINNKVIVTVTDNGSNFVKAFKEYQLDDSVLVSNDNDDKNPDDIISFTEVGQLLSRRDISDDDDDCDFFLPPHHRCSCTLNLIASHDIAAADSDSSYNRVSRSALAKCSALWNKACRHT
jgi:hypothetical protein